MSNTLKPMNWKKRINIKAPLNVHKFKTKSPFDKWSIPCDRGLQNTPFVEKMMRAPHVSKQKVQQFMNCKKIMNKGAPLNVRNFITKPPD